VIGTVTADAGGSLQFTDSAGSRRRNCFYRLQCLAVTPPKLQIRLSAGDLVILNGLAQAGQTYNVLASQDLVTWTPIGTVTTDAGGSYVFTDLAGSGRPNSVYRLQRMQGTAPTLWISASTGGSVTLSGIGEAGRTYDVQCSQNLTAWTVIGTVTIDPSGAFKFTDPAGNTRPRRLYRLQGQ
jgi:hypothetical protein